MKEAIVASLCALVAGLMIVPCSVSAGANEVVVQDRTGDLSLGGIDWETTESTAYWPDSSPVGKAGYFDMLCFWLSEKKGTFTFGMEVAADLPVEGAALSPGFYKVTWLMWIDYEPWNLKLNPVLSLYTIKLVYDGAAYAAELIDYPTGTVLATLPYTVEGSVLQIQFASDLIGSLDDFWFMPCTVVQWSASGYFDLDTTDPGSVEGQVWWDIPWGDPVWTP